MIYRLKKLNVVKIVETEKQKDKLTSNGYVEIIPEEVKKEEIPEVKVETKKGKA